MGPEPWDPYIPTICSTYIYIYIYPLGSLESPSKALRAHSRGRDLEFGAPEVQDLLDSLRFGWGLKVEAVGFQKLSILHADVMITIGSFTTHPIPH